MEEARPEGQQSAGKPRGTNKEKRDGNGEGVKAEGITFTKKSDPEAEGNWCITLVVHAYLVQCRGFAAVTDIIEDIKFRLNSRIHENTSSDALEALKKQDIIAESQGADGSRMFSMKKAKFNCTPPIANVRHLIEEVTSDSTGMLIIERFTGGSTRTVPWPKCVHVFVATFMIIRDWLGSQIWAGNESLQQKYFAAGKYLTLHECDKHGVPKLDAQGNFILQQRFKDAKDVPLMFERTCDGKIIATHAAAVKGFLINSVRACPPTEECSREHHVDNHFCFSDIVLEPEDKRGFNLVKLPALRQTSTTAAVSGCEEKQGGDDKGLSLIKLPVMREVMGAEARGAGPKNHEIIPAGTTLNWAFSCPTENFITPQQMKAWLAFILRYPNRSMSPARGAQYGAAILKSLKHKKVVFNGHEEEWVEVTDEKEQERKGG